MEELFKLPKLGLNMKEGTILKWLKNEGDFVTKGEPLLEVATGKVNVQVEAPVSGKLKKILAPAKTKVPVGEVIAQLEPVEAPECAARGGNKRFDASLAAELFDAVVIGGGPGGYVAAIRVAQLGGKVALVEKDELGGTCLNRGCIPTKTLIRSAEVFANLRKAAEFGVITKELGINFARVMERKQQVVAQLRDGIEHLMESNQIKVVRGTGFVQAKDAVKVTCDGDEVVLRTKNIIIATGSRPAQIPLPGTDLPGVLNSDEVLSLASLPKSMVMIGGGVIGVEMAWIYSTLGVDVTIVELLPRLLMPVDAEIALAVTELLRENGIKVYTQTKVQKIAQVEGGGLVVIAAGEAGQEKMFYGEKVLISIGRSVNSTGLGLEEAGVAMERGRVKVDARMMTSVPGIYAIGDVTGGMMLAHVASAQGVVAAENIMGHFREFDGTVVPSAIFTVPEIASVGLTEEQAVSQGLKIKVSRFPFAAIGKALAMGETDGQLKLICDEATGKVLGAHLYGPHATDLIAEIALAMKNGLTAREIASTIHAHPTTAEIIMEAAHGIIGKAFHLP